MSQDTLTKFQEIALNSEKKEWETILKWQDAGVLQLSPDSRCFMESIASRNSFSTAKKNQFEDSWCKKRYAQWRGSKRFEKDNKSKLYRISEKLEQNEWTQVKTQVSKAFTQYYNIKRMLGGGMILSDFWAWERAVIKKMPKNARMNRNALETRLNEGTIKDSYHSMHQYKFHEMEMMDSSTNAVNKHLLGLSNMEASLEVFYYENKLRLLCERRSRQWFFKTENPMTKEEEAFYQQLPKSVENHPQVNAYSLIMKMLCKDCEDTYFLLKSKALGDEYKHFDKDYLRPVIHYLMNFCLRQRSFGKLNFSQEYLEWTQFLECRKIHLNYDKINRARLKNMVEILLQNQELKKAEEVINTYKPHAGKSVHNQIAINFVEAHLAFAKGQYRIAYDKLSKEKRPVDDLLKISDYALRIKIHYKTKESELFESSCDNALQMLNRSNHTAKHLLDSRKKFVRNIKRLHENRNMGKSAFNAVKQEIIAAPYFYHKEWFLNEFTQGVGNPTISASQQYKP